MSDHDLVDIARPMARSFEEEDARNPAGLRERQRAAASRMLENGFSRDDVAKVYGNVLGPSQRPKVTVEDVSEAYGMAAFVRR